MDKSNLTSGRIKIKGDILAQFLNVAEGLPKQRIVLNLLEQCRNLQKLLPTVVEGRPLGRVAGGPLAGALAYDLRKNRKAASAVREINRILEGYSFRWAVPISLFVSGTEVPTVQAELYSTRPVPFSKRERGDTMEMHGAIEKVLELARIGALDAMKRCPNCQHWFMAGRKNQDYCNADCARKNYYEANRSRWSEEYVPRSRLSAKIGKRTERLLLEGFKLTKSDSTARQFQNKRTGEIARIDCTTAEITYTKKGKHHA
jgi:hypothetical protein